MRVSSFEALEMFILESFWVWFAKNVTCVYIFKAAFFCWIYHAFAIFRFFPALTYLLHKAHNKTVCILYNMCVCTRTCVFSVKLYPKRSLWLNQPAHLSPWKPGWQTHLPVTWWQLPWKHGLHRKLQASPYVLLEQASSHLASNYQEYKCVCVTDENISLIYTNHLPSLHAYQGLF